MQQSIARALARIYETRRLRAEARREARIKQVYNRFPRLEQVDRDIKAAGADLLLDVIEPGRPQLAEKRKRALEQQREALMTQFKIASDFDQPQYQCETCHDTGHVGDAPCNCYRQALIPLLIRQANIKPLSGLCFDQFDENLFSDQVNQEKYRASRSPREQMTGIRKAAEQFIRSFDEPDTRNMLFVGSPGTGKTFLMGCIAHELIQKGYPVLYTTAPQLFDTIQQRRMLRNSFNPDPTRLEEADTLYELLLTCSLLMVDDLGTEAQASVRYADLLHIIDSRQKPGLKTIISSNVEPAALRDTYDERILSRLIGQFSVYRFFGEDIRLELSRKRRQSPSG